VIRLAWPAVVQGLLTTAVFFTDRLILGGYSDAALGSMSTSGPLLWSVFSVTGAISAGTMAVVGRRSGAGRMAEAGEVMGAVLVASALLGVLVAVLGIPLRGTIATVLAGGAATSQAIRDMAAAYMGIVFAIAPLKLVGDAGFTALQASGDTRSPMWISGVCGGVNLVLSWLLVSGQLGAPELGVVGAAIGTAASFSLQSVLVLAIACSPTATFPLRAPTRALSELLGPVARISLPTLGEKGIYHAAYVAFSALVGWLGDVAMTAHQALIAIESLGFIAAGGFGVAASAIVAQRLGADAPDEASAAGWYATGLSIGALSLVSVLLWTLPEPLVGIFTDDPEIIATGARCLRIAAVAQPLMALTDGMAGALRGAGDTRSPMIAAIAGPLLVRLVLCWLLAFHLGLGLLGIWIGTTVDWAVRGAFLALVFARGRWRNIAV
jgi:MATE family multidrug resistance protein